MATDNQSTSELSLTQLAWHRFNVIIGVVSDANARFVAVLFYFTFFMPFAIISTLFSDPLRKKAGPVWLDREPVPTDIESAREQG